MSKLQLKGVMPPMVTPFKENGEVDYDAFVYNVQKWNDTKLTGYLVLGSNSETCYLTWDEKIELIKLTVANASKDKHLCVGSGMESIADTIKLTNQAAELGMQSALVLTPFYYIGKMKAKALITYFTEVADHTDIPIMIYNVPKFTHNNIEAAAVAELCKHPNIIGMKDSTGDVPQMATWKRITTPDFNCMVGTAGAWFPCLCLGVKAGIHALANCCPNECAEIQELFDAGKYEESRALYQRMFPVNSAVTGTYGIAGLKYACDRLGYKGGQVRKPLLPLTEDEKKGLDAILEKAELV